MLAQMARTTDPGELQTLAQALQALPVKLTEAQAQRALQPLLLGMDPSRFQPDWALPTLAKAVQALPAESH